MVFVLPPEFNHVIIVLAVGMHRLAGSENDQRIPQVIQVHDGTHGGQKSDLIDRRVSRIRFFAYVPAYCVDRARPARNREWTAIEELSNHRNKTQCSIAKCSRLQ